MAESGKYNALRACRTCLGSESEDNVLLDGEDLFLLLEYCVGINVKFNEEPHTICSKCIDIIGNFVDFKKKCLAADALWKSLTPYVLNCLIENYTTENENVMKNKLLDFYNKELPSLNGQNNTHIDMVYEENKYILNSEETEKIDQETIQLDVSTDCGYDNYVDDYHIIDEPCIIDIKGPIDDEIQRTDDTYMISDDNMIEDNVQNHINEKISNDMLKGELKCAKCNKIYEKEGWLKVHMRHCGKTIGKRNVTRRNKPKLLGHICGLCEFKSSSLEVVIQHFEEHRSRNDLKCQLCKFVGAEFTDMVAHRFSHSSDTYTVKRICPICKKLCMSKLRMQFHYSMAHLGRKGGYCLKCDREFTVYKTYKFHMGAHSGRKFVCDHCGTRYMTRAKLIEHLQNHKEITNFICHQCGKKFKRHKGLLLHLRSVHVKEEPVKCSHCNKMFKNLSTLKAHKKRQIPKNSLKCEICGKCFGLPYLLRSHEFWHTGERPHCCEICGSRFKAKGQLKVHMMNHAGYRPFECSLCHKCFPSLRQLKRHSSVHTGIRPFKCLHCERTFGSKKLMLAHCELRHKDSQ